MYIEDGRKMLKFAQRISASYLLYAMNKLRLSAYLCTPSGNPKLYLGSVCPFCAIFPKPGGRSHCLLFEGLQVCPSSLHSALRLRNALHFYPHIVGTKRSLFRRRRGDPVWSPVYCPHTMRTIRDLSLCGRSPLHIAQFICLSLIIRIDGGRCVKKRGKNIFFYIADMSRVFAHAVKNIENMPVMKL